LVELWHLGGVGLPGQVIPLHQASAPEVEPSDFTAIVRAFRPYVATVVARMLGRDDDEVDDLVQETFINALDGLKRLEHADRVKPYLARTAVHLTLRRLRRRRLARVFGLAERWHPTLLSTQGATGEHRVMLANVYQVLDACSADEQVAWSLRYLEGERLEQVAALIGCSLSTAKRRIAAVDAALQEAHDE
jgi:RNA polymerase sigma-70 factor, ECF subfamily